MFGKFHGVVCIIGAVITLGDQRCPRTHRVNTRSSVRVFSTRVFEPRHNILSNVRADIRKLVVSWLKHSRESDRAVPGPITTEA